MKNRLLIFGSFGHDADSVLTGIKRGAFVRIEGYANLMFRPLFDFVLRAERLVTVFTDGRQWKAKFNDSQVPFRHEPSLAVGGEA